MSRRAPGIAACALLALGGCSSPSLLGVPPPSSVALEGRVVSWTSTAATVASVRWGRTGAAWTAVAYPAAAARADLAAVTEHRIPLLALAAGDSVYLQTIERTAAGTVTSRTFAFRAAAALPAPGPLLRWTMLDVGFGDAHLLRMPGSGRRVLVDAGERRDDANVESGLARSGVTGLDVVIATHVHEDHVGGLVGDAWTGDDGVLATLPVAAVLTGAHPSGARSAWNEALALCAARGIPVTTVEPGASDATVPALAWDPSVRVVVLNAGGGRDIGGTTESDWINNDSVVLRLTYGDVSFVLGADAESPVEQALVGGGAALAASVLKVHHHGHADAAEPAYLAAIAPRAALIPIHAYEAWSGTLPSAVVLERLRQRQADVFASDRAGPFDVLYTDTRGLEVTVVSDGASYEISVAPSGSLHWPGDEEGAAAAPAAARAPGRRP